MSTLDDATRIRQLLSPERLARRGVPAQNRPHVRLWVDGKPVVAYPPPGVTPDEREAFVAIVRQQRDACQRLAALRPGGRWERHALRGMPTAAERRERTDRALARLRQGNLVTVRRAVGR